MLLRMPVWLVIASTQKLWHGTVLFPRAESRRARFCRCTLMYLVTPLRMYRGTYNRSFVHLLVNNVYTTINNTDQPWLYQRQKKYNPSSQSSPMSHKPIPPLQISMATCRAYRSLRKQRSSLSHWSRPSSYPTTMASMCAPFFPICQFPRWPDARFRWQKQSLFAHSWNSRPSNPFQRLAPYRPTISQRLLVRRNRC